MLLDLLNTGLSAAELRTVQILFHTDSAGAVRAQSGSISAGTVEILAPLQIGGAGGVQVQISNENTQIAQIAAVMVPAAPGIFSGAGGQAIAVNQDGTLNSETNPAARGSVLVLYGTGQGINGLPVSVTVGGYAAGVLYSGPVSTFPGLWQLNVRMPAGYVAPGTMAVIVNVGGASSQPGVFLTLN